MQNNIFNKISNRWRVGIEKITNRKTVHQEKRVNDFSSYQPASSIIDRHEVSRRLLWELLQKYRDKPLLEVIQGKEIQTAKGTCYQIQSDTAINLPVTSTEFARKQILSNLKLLSGIGNNVEDKLKQRGYHTIQDLVDHPRYGTQAKEILCLLENQDIHQLNKRISRWFPKSHPLALYPSAFYDIENFVFFDTETLGLFGSPIILFGLAKFSKESLHITQYLVRDIGEETSALLGFLSHLDENCVFITFNGKSFDIPYVNSRLAYYNIRTSIDKPHFDLRFFSKRAWGEKIPNCKLSTLEQYLLGIHRQDDVPGDMVPTFYQSYLKNKNVGPLIPIIEHNKQDLITLARIFAKLHEEWGGSYDS